MDQPQLIGQAKQFNEKINTIKSQFFSALDDFKKYYVYYNKNPEVNEFQNYYVNSKGQLQNMSRDLFLTTNNIDKNIDTLDKQMSAISAQLDDEKKLNKEMMELIANLENTQNGSEVLIDDSKERYNQQWTRNIEMFLCIIFISVRLFGNSFFKSSPPIPVK
jgi:midasin (ATPase involved in ribosome maturation)